MKEINLGEIWGYAWGNHTIKKKHSWILNYLPAPYVHVPATHRAIFLTLEVSILASLKAVVKECISAGLFALTILTG